MYKVWVLAYGEKTWATNGLEFETAEDAGSYGRDLLSRWFGAKEFAVLPVSPEYVGYLSTDTVEKAKVS